MAVLTFLAHAVEHFLCFCFCRFVHAGFIDFLLELLNVRHILGMKFIQFLLQEIHLFTDRLFTV